MRRRVGEGRIGERRGLGGFGGFRCFRNPGVQLIPDFLRSVGAALALGPGDHHPGGGDAREACQS
jgi:hypothetical protein